MSQFQPSKSPSLNSHAPIVLWQNRDRPESSVGRGQCMCLSEGDILRDRYRIIRQLGKGGFGITYLAEDLNSKSLNLCDRLRVVKAIAKPESDGDDRILRKAREKFEQEARTLARLGHHPQIPQLFNHFEDSDYFYIVQEYIEGHPLSDELIPEMPWSEAQVIDLLRDILGILEFVHDNDVIHRDIKPSNLIRRQRDGKIVLIDFGAVKEISILMDTNSGSIATTAIGTVYYMPPEQTKGQPRFNSDIYALGIVGIQALTGDPPSYFLHDPRTSDIVWDYSTPDRAMRPISDQFRAILNKMVRYLFNARYQSVEEVLQDLSSQNYSSISPQQTLPNPKPEPKSPRSNLLFFLLTSAVLVTSIALYKLLTPKKYSLQLGDNLSVGEEVLVSNSNPFPKQLGISEIQQCQSRWLNLPMLLRFIKPRQWQDCFGDKSNYKNAVDDFTQAWNESRDPETLIYLNNTLLEAIDANYYTIAVAVPIRKNDDGTVKNSDLAQEILRGVAQAQTEVNLALLSEENAKDLPGGEILPNNPIEKHGKKMGIRVIIADDANDERQAMEVAKSLVKIPNLFGVVGHYASDMTFKTIGIYDRHKLAMISPSSTSEWFTEHPHDFFFRTVHSTRFQAQALVQYLMDKVEQPKAAVFYNNESPFTHSFQNEFKTKFIARGGTIVQEFPNLHKGNFDADKAIEAVRKTGDTAIVLIPDGDVTDSLDHAIEMMKANRDRHWLGEWRLYNWNTLETASKLPFVENLVVSVPWHSLSSPNPEFPQNARQLWGGSVSAVSALAYDAAQALVQAIALQDRPSRRGMQKILRSPEFSTEGATGTIQFDSKTGDRLNSTAQLLRIVPCKREQFGMTFVPIQYQTAQEAGLKCEVLNN